MAHTTDHGRHGGQILMQQLRIHGVRRVFLLPGESYLPRIDALNDHAGAIQPVVCRQESGAAYMAEAYGKLTGEPGICFVTRGPGATNASIGLHTAFQDSTPMILFVGQVATGFLDREAFQEIDYRRMLGPVAKWVAQIDQTERIPEYVSRAFSVATSGRAGPVVLVLPEDTLWGRADVPDLPPYPRVLLHPGWAELQALKALLAQAQRPLMILGGSGWSVRAVQDIAGFAHRFGLPVAVAWRRLECFDQSDAHFAGQVGWAMHGALEARVRAADLILAVGTRLGEATTIAYSLIESPQPRQRLVHVHPDVAEIGRVFVPALGIAANVACFAQAAAQLAPDTAPDMAAARQAHAEYLQSLEPLPAPGPLSLDALSAHVNQVLPDDACITVGAGNYALYPHRYRQFRGPGTSLAPTLGTMGYGLPAALSAKLEQPEREVICYAGDGCFQMTMQELGVAMQYGLGIVILLFNNGCWGTIKAHQAREFPNRCVALDFSNPAFCEIVQAYGGQGEVVDRTEAFPAAFERARAFARERRLPALVEIRYAPEGIAPGETLSAIRSQALAAAQSAVAGSGRPPPFVNQPK
ncbi:thiamine pyrophosphate-binding protein [Castellaniella sp.]|uniref:thiamine pyrophosphate-binding protein n=1 Tax=Castellaniella sp. TaxID=1955812 RepID=UPI0035675209